MGVGTWRCRRSHRWRCDRRSHHPSSPTDHRAMWSTQATHSRCTDPGATGHSSLSTTLQAALSAIPADRYKSALAMLRLRRPARLRRQLRPRQNDRVSRRIKSQRSSDKPPWDNALLHRARVASAPRLQGRNHSLICRPVMNACGSRHPAMTNAIKEIIRTM